MTITKTSKNRLEITKILSGGEYEYLLNKDDENKIFTMKERIDNLITSNRKAKLQMLLINALDGVSKDKFDDKFKDEILAKPAFVDKKINLSPYQQLEKVDEDLSFIYQTYIINVLYKANIGLLISISKSILHKQGANVGLMDCINAGYEGLLEGIRRFDYQRVNDKTKKTYKFSTNATWWIKQRIQSYLASSSQIIATPQYIRANKNKHVKDAEILELQKEDSAKSRKQLAKRLQEKQIEKMSSYSSLDKIELNKDLQYKLPKEESTPETNYDDGIMQSAFNEVFEKYLTHDEIVAYCYMKGYNYKDINIHKQELHARQVSKLTGMSIQKINGLLYSAKKRLQSNKEAFRILVSSGRDSDKLGSLDKWYYRMDLPELLPFNETKGLVLKTRPDGSLVELRALLSITDPYDVGKYIAKTKEYKRAMKSYKKQLRYVVVKDGRIIVDTPIKQQVEAWYSLYLEALRQKRD